MSAPSVFAARELLVCVYYRVRTPDVPVAIARVRDIQRTLGERFAGLRSEVLLRCEAGAVDPTAAPRDRGGEPAGAVAVDETLMETYRLPLPAPAPLPLEGAAPHAPEAARFLAALAAAAAPLAALQRGDRHVEVFMPCAS